MDKNPYNRTISNNQSTSERSRRDAADESESESQLSLDDEPNTFISTYASFYWLINYIKMCNFRLANDLYTSFMNYWFPGRVLLPPHIVQLMQVQSRLRAEHDSHSVTYSRERPGVHTSPLSMRKFVKAIKTYILSSEDETGIHYTSKDLGKLGNDREPMFVIVDSHSVSSTSSKELLIDNRFHARDTVLKRHFNKNVKPVDLPSTSRDLRNDFMPPLLLESESIDEMQMVDINLQSENELSLGADPDCDNDSIVVSYLKNKNALLDLEATLLMSTKKKSSLLESVPKMETILESELFNAFPIKSKSNNSNTLDYFKNGDKTNLIGRFIGSVPSVTTALKVHTFEEKSKEATTSTTSYKDPIYSSKDEHGELLEAIEFLHHDNEFLMAAELGDENTLEMLIEQGTDIHYLDHLGRNALHWAICSSGNKKAVALLLAAGVNPNVSDHLGMTSLSLCLMRSPSYEMATLLFDHGAKIEPRVRPMDTGLFLQFVMMCIPTEEEEKILHLLVERGALVNDPEAPGGRQALHVAAMSNNTHLINILVELGADVFAVNHRNETPIQVAATFNCKEAYALLDQIDDLCSIIQSTQIISSFKVGFEGDDFN